MSLVIGLIAGAFGGNVAGNVSRKLDQGFLLNSAAGIIGGGMGVIGLAMTGLGAGRGALDLGSLITQAAGGCVGGAVFLTLVGMLSNLAK